MVPSRSDLILLSVVPGSNASRARLGELLSAGDPVDWHDLLHQLSAHQIVPLFRYSLAGTGLDPEIPAPLRSQIDEEARLWAARHLSTVNETFRIIELLQPAGLDAIPLKGAALINGGYYPEIGLRTAVDIDLLVDPERIDDAHNLLTVAGYRPLPGRRDVRPRQRLPNELNHLWPLRSPGGTVIELHHRAFHLSRGEINLDYRVISAGAVRRKSDQGVSITLPSPHHLAIHLIHHTLIDLQSTHLALRTMADLHAILEHHPESREAMLELSDSFGVKPVTGAALELCDLMVSGAVADLISAGRHPIFGLLLRTMVSRDPTQLSESARLFEYLDLSRQPLRKIGNIASLVFTKPAHMDQLYGKPKFGLRPLQYLRRLLDLTRRFPWKGLMPESLVEVWRIRRISAGPPRIRLRRDGRP